MDRKNFIKSLALGMIAAPLAVPALAKDVLKGTSKPAIVPKNTILTYAQGQTACLTASFTTPAGIAVDVPDATIEIQGCDAALMPKSMLQPPGMVGFYYYDWTIPASFPVGMYTVIFSGTIQGVPNSSTLSLNVETPTMAKDAGKPNLEDILEKARKARPGVVFTHEHFSGFTPVPSWDAECMGTEATSNPVLFVWGHHRDEKNEFSWRYGYCKSTMHRYDKDGYAIFDFSIPLSTLETQAALLSALLDTIDNLACYDSDDWQQKDIKFIAVATCSTSPNGVDIHYNNRPILRNMP